MVNWGKIETVLLDMDGTLLDLNFDNHFWLEHMPLRYSEASSISLEDAKAELVSRYTEVEGTMDWYCVDYWSDQLGMDIAALKKEVDHLIAVHPNVINFLDAVRTRRQPRTRIRPVHRSEPRTGGREQQGGFPPAPVRPGRCRSPR